MQSGSEDDERNAGQEDRYSRKPREREIVARLRLTQSQLTAGNALGAADLAEGGGLWPLRLLAFPRVRIGGLLGLAAGRQTGAPIGVLGLGGCPARRETADGQSRPCHGEEQ